jgi:hypothetical protein
VVGRYLDVLAPDPLAELVNKCSVKGRDQVRVVFLDPEARGIYADWPTVAADTVASLRATAGSGLDDPRLTELVGELSLKSEDFWARHDVGVKTTGQSLLVYHAEPGARRSAR